MNHTIQVKISAIYGIAVFDENMRRIEDFGGKTSKGQISCVVGLSRHRSGTKSEKSLPLRQSKGSLYRGDGAIWPRNSLPLSLDTKLKTKKKQKTFEISILLDRGKEQILIGLASLKVFDTVLETEVDIPIHTIASKTAIQILVHAKTRARRRFIGKPEIKDSFFQSNPYTMINGVKTVSFQGGDNERKYALEKGAFIRLKCSCLPKSGKIDIVHLESLLTQKTVSYDNSVLLNTSSITTWPMNISIANMDDNAFGDQKASYDLDDVLVETQDSMRIHRKKTFEEKQSSSRQISLDSSTHFSYHSNEREIIDAKKRKSSVLNNFGSILENQCIGKMTDRCFQDNSFRYTKSSEEIPSAVRFSMKRNPPNCSELPLPKDQSIFSSSVAPRKRDPSTGDESRMQGSQISMTIPKQESFGTEFFANVLGIDINELKNVMSDRLVCSNSQTKSSKGLFSRERIKSLFTDESSTSTYDTDSTESSSGSETSSSYSSETSISGY